MAKHALMFWLTGILISVSASISSDIVTQITAITPATNNTSGLSTKVAASLEALATISEYAPPQTRNRVWGGAFTVMAGLVVKF